MATNVYITGLSGSQASAQEILGSTGVNRGFRIPALAVDGVAVGTRDDPFGDLGTGTRQKEVAVVPGHIYTVDVDDPETRKRLSRRHGNVSYQKANWIEVPAAANPVSATATLTSDNTNPVAGDTVTINNVTYRFETTLALANDVHIGANADATLVSLGKAVNQNGVVGTDYFTGTVAPTNVTANAENATNHSITFVASPGTAGNAFPSTETSAHLSFGAATFQGGAADGSASTSLLTSVTLRSLLTESGNATAQSFVSRGTPVQNQGILYVGTDTEEDILAAAVTVDLTNPAVRRALRLHAGAWSVANSTNGLVTIRGLMTTKSLPTSTGGYGLSSGRGFRIPVWESFNPSATSSNLGYVNSTANLQVDLTNANVRRALRRNVGRWVVVTAP